MSSSTSDWRRVRIIVEVPVLGEVTHRDVRWAVESAIERGNLGRQLRATHGMRSIGRIQVKTASRVEAAEALHERERAGE